MPVIMTVHIAQSRSRCEASQCIVIIQALAPVIGPYMSRDIDTIQLQDTMGTMTSSTTVDIDSRRNADSRSVGGRSAGAPAAGMVINIEQRRGRWLRTEFAAMEDHDPLGTKFLPY